MSPPPQLPLHAHRFPSLLITADSLTPQGAFAEAQAQYLAPAPDQVTRLVTSLTEKKIGVVAHFYMDPQVGQVAGGAAGRVWQWRGAGLRAAGRMCRCEVQRLVGSKQDVCVCVGGGGAASNRCGVRDLE
jgi:hypothetical protein